MKTFLKIVLGLVLVVVAIKLIPLALFLMLGVSALVAIAALVGLSAMGGILCAAIAVAAVLSPIWLPVLAVFGIVALVKKSEAGVVKAT